MDITLPFLPDAVSTVDDMMGKVPKLRYAGHDVSDATKFLELVEDNYLINTGEIGPLGWWVLDPAQWITWLYNLGITNILYILHFGRNKNVIIYIKYLVSWVHRGILWMEIPMKIDVALISKITGLSRVDAQPKYFLKSKAREKELAGQVKA